MSAATMTHYATPDEIAHALNHGFAVELDDMAQAVEVAKIAGPGRPLRMTIEPCTGLQCRCSGTVVIERLQRWES